MKKTVVFTICSLAILFSLTAQNDNPYAVFGYEGNILRTPQERQQFMLIIENADKESPVKKLGIDPENQKYYAFGESDEIIASDNITPIEVTRFLSVDPLAKDFPWNSVYAFAENDVIRAIDLEGLERRINIYQTDNGTTTLTVFDSKSLLKAVSTNGGYFKFEKISKEQYQNLAQGFHGTYGQQKGNGFFFEPNGYNQYRNYTTLYRGQKNEQYNPNSNIGTLSLAVTPNNGTILNYSSSVEGEFKSDVNPSIYWKAFKTFNPIIPISDPLVEGSGNYATAVGLYKTGITLPITGTAALTNPNNWVRAAAGLSVLNGIDDFTALGTQNGNTLIQNLPGGNVTKATLSTAGVAGSVFDPTNAQGLINILPNVMSGAADANSATQNFINAASKEKEDENK